MRRLFVAAAVLVFAGITHAQTTIDSQCLPERNYVRAGVGAAPYERGVSEPTEISWDEFQALKYPRTIRSERDLPSALAPRTRIGGLETTLWKVSGYQSCGSQCPNGPVNFVLEKASGQSGIVGPSFGYPLPVCRERSPLKEAIDAVNTELFKQLGGRDGCTGGCGYLSQNITIIGYGFWEEFRDLNATGGYSVRPAIYPVVDIIYSRNVGADPGTGGTGGTGGTDGPAAPPPAPPPPGLRILLPEATSDQLSIDLQNNSSTSVTITTAPTSASFAADAVFGIEADGGDTNGLSVSITPDRIASPGVGQATVTFAAGPHTFPRTYVATLTVNANAATHSVAFLVNVVCTPPSILGIDQPKSQSVTRGSTATLTVKATGSGPFDYQWYSGSRGNTRTPIAGATNTTFTTPAVTSSETYWARVSNACGSTDSATITVTPR